MAERDVSAKHERPGAGTTVVGYLDLLAQFGHDEHPGDGALRARYQRPSLAVLDSEEAEEESAE